MAAIQIADLDNGKVDVDHLAKFANSTELTAVDRMGRTKRTLAGIDAAAVEQSLAIRTDANVMLAGLGYMVPVAYAADLLMNAPNQAVSYNGDTYAPIQGELPFVTSGIFETSKFRLLQGLSVTDVQDTNGTGLVGILDVLDNARPMQSYMALRAYTGRAAGVRLTQSGIAGQFQRDALDITTPDDGGTVIVDAIGRRWKRLVDGVVSLRWFATGAGDETAKVQSAFNAAAGKKLDLDGLTCTITSAITMPSITQVIGEGSWVLTGDVDYWFSAATPYAVIWDNFISTMTLAFSSRTMLNRAMFLDTPTYAEVKYLESTGASTVLHCFFGEELVVGQCKLREVQGTAAQYGYGINSSAKRTTINSIDAENSDSSSGRHAVYINGDQWQFANVGSVRVKNWNKSPIHFVATANGGNFSGHVENAVFENCNMVPLGVTTGCIHITEEDGTSPTINMAIGSIRGSGCAGPLLANLSTGTGACRAESVVASGVPIAAIANSNIVYYRFGKNKTVGSLIVDALNTSWQGAFYSRDGSEGHGFDYLQLGGVVGSQAATFVDTLAIVGAISSPGVVPILNTGSTLRFRVKPGEQLHAPLAPTTGTWRRGDVVWNSAPSAGGSMGWTCVVAGTPGTWKTFGSIAA